MMLMNDCLLAKVGWKSQKVRFTEAVRVMRQLGTEFLKFLNIRLKGS